MKNVIYCHNGGCNNHGNFYNDSAEFESEKQMKYEKNHDYQQRDERRISLQAFHDLPPQQVDESSLHATPGTGDTQVFLIQTRQLMYFEPVDDVDHHKFYELVNIKYFKFICKMRLLSF
ncbi:MAG: hypothetical protein NT175_10625 [Bacteroidetes bacterium]|nr:hypothetical protein [Bacteroidota bacterium]